MHYNRVPEPGAVVPSHGRGRSFIRSGYSPVKNFIRALRFAWTYRIRLIISIFCALCAAAFWSLNFTAIYPVLKIVGSDQNLQQWVNNEIVQTQKQIEEWDKIVDSHTKKLEIVQGYQDIAKKEKQEKEISRSLAKVTSKLEPARHELYRYLWAKKLIDQLFPEDRFMTLVVVICLVVVGVAIKGFFEFWQESLVGSVVGLSLYDLRNSLYRNVIRLDVNYFGETGTSKMMATFTNDMEMLANGQRTLFGKVVAEPLKAIGCLVVACWISWQLTLMFMVLVPVAIFVLNKVARTMKKATRKLLERMSNIYKLLQESFKGIRVVKGFTMEPYERRRFSQATKDYYRKALWVVKLDAMAGPIIETLGVIAVAGALLVGAYLVMNQVTHLPPWGIRMLDHPMEPETLMQLYVLLGAIADPVRKLSNVYTRIQSGAAAADRIFKFMDETPKVQANTDGPRLIEHKETITFRDVCFSYEPQTPILTNINLEVRHGETIAIVGKNGSGKSTMLGLIPRFFDPDHGKIFVDGINIREANLRKLRQQIGIVTQDPILFDDTVFNNIAYGNRQASREQVEEAAVRALIHDHITTLPNQYETKVGESGVKFSGGQKQRIALARAILRDPQILILDEFTSAADTLAENEIHRVLREFMQGRTTFVITHRLNTLEIADRIVVLEQGRIEAEGTHKELLATCRVYQLLHEAQFQRMVA